MSPKISIAIKLPSFAEQLRGKPPRYQVLASLALVRGQGATLHQQGAGVVADPRSRTWIIERTSRPAIGITGALLLALQPNPGDEEDVSGVAARALGTQLAYVVGLEDGWAGEGQSEFWMKADLNRRHYLAGYVVGVQALAAASVYCIECGSRRWKGEGKCPGCDR